VDAMPQILQLKRISENDNTDTTTWVDIDLRDEGGSDWVERKSGLSTEVRQRLLGHDDMSRREILDGGLFICFRAQFVLPHQTKSEPASIRMWIEPDRVITVHSAHLPACDALRAAATDSTGNWAPFEILAFLARRDVEQFETVINDVIGKIDKLEDQIMDANDDAVEEQLPAIRRMTIRARRHLVTHRNLIAFVTSDESLPISKSERRALESAKNHVLTYLESLEDCHERTHLLQDQLDARMTSRLNRITYQLTLVATVFLPLSFLTGLLGMNVAGIPEEHNPLAFALVCVVMVLIAIGFWLFFRWRRWI
jgi:zinc transporter